MRFLANVRTAVLPGAILLLVLVMVVPIPSALLDVFFVANIAISLAVLMVALERAETARLFRVSDRATVRDVVPAWPERRIDADRAGPRPRGRGGGGACDRGVRDVPDRRRLCRRYLRLRDPDDHQPDRRDQGRRARVRSVGALHARRLAGQADGDRRRSQRRADHAGPGQGAPRRGVHGSRLLRLDGRFVQVREGRCGRRDADPRRQHHRRADPGAGEPRAFGRRRGQDLHPARDRRCAGRAAAEPDAVDRGGGDRDAGQLGQGSGRADRAPVRGVTDVDAGGGHPSAARHPARHAAFRAAPGGGDRRLRGVEAQTDRAAAGSGRRARGSRAGRRLAHRLGRGDRGHAGAHRHRLRPRAARRRAPRRAADGADHRRPAAAVERTRLRRAAGQGARRHRAGALHLPADRQRRCRRRGSGEPGRDAGARHRARPSARSAARRRRTRPSASTRPGSRRATPMRRPAWAIWWSTPVR